MGANNSPRMNAGCQGNGDLMKKLQKVDFSIVDTVLYLDAYPHCPKAKARYNELIAERAALLSAMSAAGKPINNMSVTSDGWSWGDGPWPWEYDANV